MLLEKFFSDVFRKVAVVRDGWDKDKTDEHSGIMFNKKNKKLFDQRTSGLYWNFNHIVNQKFHTVQER